MKTPAITNKRWHTDSKYRERVMSRGNMAAADKLVKEAKDDRKRRSDESAKDVEAASKEIASGIVGIAKGRHLKMAIGNNIKIRNCGYIPPADQWMIDEYFESEKRLKFLSAHYDVSKRSEIQRHNEIIERFRPSLVKSGIIKEGVTNASQH